MGIMVYSLLWVMQDFVHQPYNRGLKNSNRLDGYFRSISQLIEATRGILLVYLHPISKLKLVRLEGSGLCFRGVLPAEMTCVLVALVLLCRLSMKAVGPRDTAS